SLPVSRIACHRVRWPRRAVSSIFGRDMSYPLPFSAAARRAGLCVLLATAGVLCGGPPARAAEPSRAPVADLKPKGKLHLLGADVAPGTRKRLTWSGGLSMEGFVMPAPVVVLNGKGPGPVVCLTAALHGDELNGIEVARRVLDDIDVEELNGAIISVPIVNIQGFYRGTRYLPDRRDLNRYFPGNDSGSAA